MVIRTILELRMQVGICPEFIGLNIPSTLVDRIGLAGDRIGPDSYLKTIY